MTKKHHRQGRPGGAERGGGMITPTPTETTTLKIGSVSGKQPDAWLPANDIRPRIGIRFDIELAPGLGIRIAEELLGIYSRLGPELQAKLATFPGLSEFTPEEMREIGQAHAQTAR
jgi:hypothetical protein